MVKSLEKSKMKKKTDAFKETTGWNTHTQIDQRNCFTHEVN